MDYSVTDTMWVFFCAILVFFMNLGFAAVEAGFARAKNCVNILSKNFIVFAVSSLGFLILWHPPAIIIVDLIEISTQEKFSGTSS